MFFECIVDGIILNVKLTPNKLVINKQLEFKQSKYSANLYNGKTFNINFDTYTIVIYNKKLDKTYTGECKQKQPI